MALLTEPDLRPAGKAQTSGPHCSQEGPAQPRVDISSSSLLFGTSGSFLSSHRNCGQCNRLRQVYPVPRGEVGAHAAWSSGLPSLLHLFPKVCVCGKISRVPKDPHALSYQLDLAPSQFFSQKRILRYQKVK